MANGKMIFGKQSGGTLGLVFPDGVTDTEVTLPESGVVATEQYVDGKMVLSTAVNASGTAIDFTNIPSWVKRITVMFNGVSLNSASSLLIQIGTSSGIENTGYIATTLGQNSSGSAGGFSSTAGLPIYMSYALATFSGIVRLLNLTSNTWIFESNGKFSATEMVSGAGNKNLPTKLDRLRITTVNGTDSFDTGQINIIYEG